MKGVNSLIENTLPKSDKTNLPLSMWEVWLYPLHLFSSFLETNLAKLILKMYSPFSSHLSRFEKEMEVEIDDIFSSETGRICLWNRLCKWWLAKVSKSQVKEHQTGKGSFLSSMNIFTMAVISWAIFGLSWWWRAPSLSMCTFSDTQGKIKQVGALWQMWATVILPHPFAVSSLFCSNREVSFKRVPSVSYTHRAPFSILGALYSFSGVVCNLLVIRINCAL